MSTAEALAEAIEKLRAGDLDAAEAGLKAILDEDPDNAEALQYVGLLVFQRGHPVAAADVIRHALGLKPDMAGAHNNLGNILRALGRHKEAAEAYFKALEIDPHFADGWCNVAVMLRNVGRLEEAVDVLTQAVEFNPDHGESWHNLGMYLGMLGQVEGAAAALGNCARVAYDSRWYSPGMHAYVLAAMGEHETALKILEAYLERTPNEPNAMHMLSALRGEAMERASDSYVRKHFDEFSEAFDSTLRALEYRGPHLVAAEVQRLRGDGPAFAEVVDLGCGTGLAGALVRPHATRLIGVDLSPGMLRRAEQRGVYDGLEEAELIGYLRALPAASVDLAICVDTLVYIGALEPVFGGLVHALRPGAAFVATVEAHEDATQPYILTASGRFSHVESYIRAAAAEAGLSVTTMEPAVTRRELGKPVPSLLFTLTRP